VTNRRGYFNVEFHEGDALMLVHAMMIASTTAWMCGYPGARDRFNEYKEKFEEHVPAMARLFDEEAWAEIVMALQSSPGYEVEFTPDWRGGWGDPPEEKTGKVRVIVGDKTWKCVLWGKVGEEDFKRKHVAELVRTLDVLAPLDCTGTVTEGREAA
jgi:hypothetical protein